MGQAYTISEIIEKVDELEPNQYAAEDKMEWLSALDGQLFEEVIQTHFQPIRETFTEYSGEDDELLVPFPYGADLYCWYLQAKIAAENAEAAKYQINSAMYNQARQEWVDYYNRTHTPCPKSPRFWF